jgi:hypothetical protein
MRIIITGQAGTRKTQLAAQLRNYTLNEMGVRSHHPASAHDFRWYEVEANQWLGGDFLNFLNSYKESVQNERWANALKAITEDLTAEDPIHCLILIHAAIYRNGRFVSPLSWDELLLLQPDCIVTLIDDIYDIWQRIEQGPHDTHFSLDEILTWRSVEIMNAKTLALNLRLNKSRLKISGKLPNKVAPFFGSSIPHFVMSVKHPLETFHRLFFETSRPVIYASFPITRTREREARVADIDSFRNDLRGAGATVIDPLTIDELRIPIEDPLWWALREDDKYQEYHSRRWKLTAPAIAPEEVHANPFCKLSETQVLQVRKAIMEQVVDRDFRLVAQSKQVVAYRPYYPEDGYGKFGRGTKSPTDGVTREMQFAAELERAVWAFHPKCDWQMEQDTGLFGQKALWGNVRRFPRHTDMHKLDNDDFSGFSDLLAEVGTFVVNKP